MVIRRLPSHTIAGLKIISEFSSPFQCRFKRVKRFNDKCMGIVMKIGIVGCAGRMGQMLIKEVLGNPRATLIGATEAPNSSVLGHDPGLLAGGVATDLKIT
jgi:hypothetical protein